MERPLKEQLDRIQELCQKPEVTLSDVLLTLKDLAEEMSAELEHKQDRDYDPEW